MMSSKRLLGALAAAAALAVAAPTTASANVQVGSSGWQWGNPLPQGNSLRSMSFAGIVGYAAGDFGTLLKTADGGATYSGLRVGTFQNLTTVQAVDANTIVAGGGCVGRRSVDGGATFTRIAFTPVEAACKEPLVGLSFVSPTAGYVLLADGTVLLTADGGTEFAQRTAVPGTKAAGGSAAPTDISFVSPTAGYAATSVGQIYQSTDAGQSWKLVSDTQRNVADISFVDADHGFAVGNAGLFLRTVDGGATWVPKDVGASGANLASVRCANVSLCVAATAKGDALVRTTDAGETASVVSASTAPIFAAAFASPTRVAAAGAQGASVISDDGGANFAAIGSRLTGRYSAVRAGAQAGSAFAPGDNGSLAKTVDGGKTWTRGNVATSEDILDVSFPSATVGYALDVTGGVFRTSSGGSAWKTLDPGTTANAAAIYATGPDSVITVGPTGLRRSTDGGETFSAVKGKAVSRTQLSGIDRAGPSAIVAYGSQDVIRSTDGGKTWSAIKKPGRYRRLGGRLRNGLGVAQADFVSARSGFLRDRAGRLYRTADGGTSWTELVGLGSSDAYGMSFASAKAGYLVIPRFGDAVDRGGFLLRTVDAGNTWHPQFVVDEPIAAAGVASTAGGMDFLLGGDSALLASSSGGDAGASSSLSLTTKRRSLRKPAPVTVTGRLGPAQGNERVTVSYRRPGSTFWQHQTVKTAAHGSFTTSWRLSRGSNLFVAQWPGNFRSQGDGSSVLSVKVGRS